MNRLNSVIDALHYAEWVGGVIPTEWMWEKAARGLDGGGGLPDPAHLATDDTSKVDAFPKTRTMFGCAQMVGNVSECCTLVDEPSGEYLAPLPTEELLADPNQLKALRGACFLRRGAKTCNTYHRRRLSVARRNRWTGFRVAWVD